MDAIPLEQGRFFNFGDIVEKNVYLSQSLWSRDGFSINSTIAGRTDTSVAIPLEQGRFFNYGALRQYGALPVAIPLEQGQFFN